MAVIHFATLVANNALTQFLNAIDAGSNPGTIKIYTGTMPATPETALTSQVLLATLTLQKPCGVVANKQFISGTIAMDEQADAQGTPTWGRISDGNGTAVFDGDVSLIGGGGTIQFNSLSVAKDGPVRCSSFVIYLP